MQSHEFIRICDMDESDVKELEEILNNMGCNISVPLSEKDVQLHPVKYQIKKSDLTNRYGRLFTYMNFSERK